MTEYLLVITTTIGPDILIHCESEHDLKRRAGEVGTAWQQAADSDRRVMQIQGDLGMHSVQPSFILRIDPVVRKPRPDPAAMWTEGATVLEPEVWRNHMYNTLTDHNRDRED